MLFTLMVRRQRSGPARRDGFLKEDTLPQSTPRTYDVAPDGRFLMIKEQSDSKTGPEGGLVVVQNWLEEVKARFGR